jgi:preprotein translocase subunit SecE
MTMLAIIQESLDQFLIILVAALIFGFIIAIFDMLK